MKTLKEVISDLAYDKFEIKQEQLSFTDIIELVSKELMRQNLD